MCRKKNAAKYLGIWKIPYLFDDKSNHLVALLSAVKYGVCLDG